MHKGERATFSVLGKYQSVALTLNGARRPRDQPVREFALKLSMGTTVSNYTEWRTPNQT